MYVRIAAQRPGMSYSEYSERLNITITVTDEAVPEPTPDPGLKPEPEPTPGDGEQGGGADGSGGTGVPAGGSTSTTTTVTTNKSKGKGENGKKSGGTELASTGDSTAMTVAALWASPAQPLPRPASPRPSVASVRFWRQRPFSAFARSQSVTPSCPKRL